MNIYYTCEPKEKDVKNSMGKKHKEEKLKKKKGVMKFGEILTPEQKAKYRQIGMVDMSQNWLELFNPDVISDLQTIMKSCSDNQLKSDYISKELYDLGFEDVGLGTNIAVMSHPYYPGVVFKIALDEFGIADNFNDCVLQNLIPRYNRVLARDPSGMVSVQERHVLMTPGQREVFAPQIMDLLKAISNYYLVVDLGLDMFLNYGVTREGNFVIIDGSDLFPLKQMKRGLLCKRIVGEHKKTGELKRCEGKLVYSKDFSRLVCTKCGAEFLPSELRPVKEVEKMTKILSDGTSAEEREEYESAEIRAIRTKHELVHSSVEEKPRRVSFEEFMARDADEDEEEAPESKEDDEIVEEDDVVIVKTKQTPAMKNSGSVGSVNACGEGEPEEESSQSDEAQAEAMQGTERDEDGFIMLKEKQDMSPTKTPTTYAPPPKEDTYMDDMNEAAEKCINILNRFKNSDDEELVSLFNKIIDRVGAIIPEPDRQVEEDHEVEQDSEPMVENETTNNKIMDTDPVSNDTAHIHYRVVNETLDDPDDSSGVLSPVDINQIPGIYLDIHGDFDEAYEETGIPIFVSVDNGSTYCKAIDAFTLKSLMNSTVEDAMAEFEMLNEQREEPKSKED